MILQDDEDEFGFGFEAIDRMLAGGSDEKDNIDYTILNYGICTLYLVLFVEFVRHTINHAAHGRPFFTAVLSMAYSELATLGIVEFGVFLWGKYGYLEKDIKKNFADVHFALFFTAIFNAFQYGLTSIFSTRRSNRMWVNTEQLELDHYVEIREEYDLVNEIIDSQYKGFLGKLVLFAGRSGLRRRHEMLRVQVKFHELRLHFLESNNLPYSLKVSDYLKRSEVSMLIGLVHVSAATWVLLIALMNLAYFCIGMIEVKMKDQKMEDPRINAKIMFGILFGVYFLFIALSSAFRWKMRRIFQQVLKRKVIETSDHEEGIKNQKQLFWFGSPPLVIYMIQLMNFGYALSFSIVIIFLEYIHLKDLLYVAVITVGCYFIFLYNLSALLPEYTLCTSLGYLTNRKELHETVAMHRLEEAERQRRRDVIEKATVNNSTIFQAYPAEISTTATKNCKVDDEQKGLEFGLRDSVDRVLPDTKDKTAPLLVSDLVKTDTKKLRNILPEESRENLINREERIRQRRLNRKKSLSDGVAAMRVWNQGHGANSQEKKETIKQKHRSRIKKTKSQPGVIQGWQKITASEQQKNIPYSMDDSDVARIVKESKIKKSNSDPHTIQVWKDSPLLGKGKVTTDDIFVTKDKDPVFIKEGGESIVARSEDSIPECKTERIDRLSARKRARKKTQSASAVIQSWQDYSTHEPPREKYDAISDEKNSPSYLKGSSLDDEPDDNIFTMKLKTTSEDEDRIDNQMPFIHNMLSLHTLREDEVHDAVSPREGGTFEATDDASTVIDLSEAIIIDNDKEDYDNDDNGTVDMGQSIGNLSDVDVIQAETVGISSHPKKGIHAEKNDLSCQTALIRKAKLYFIGPVYPDVSHVLGTSLVFFFVGHRVQLFSQNQDEKKQIPKIWFWLETMMFLCFIVADFSVMTLFPFWKSKTKSERQLVLAATTDLLIVTAVMALFFIAEAKRCCINESEVTQTSSQRERNLAIDEEDLFESECTCLGWGGRTYGDLGIIEPFTSLIVLRLFRFQFAQFLNRIFPEKRYSSTLSNDLKDSCDTQQYNDNTCVDRHGHVHTHNKVHKSGTALELWECAMAEFPDIVEKYGQFSGELLQVMLGQKFVIESPSLSASVQPNTSDFKQDNKMTLNEAKKLESHIKLAGSNHAKLPPRAQAIIIAGHLGKPVKPMYLELYEKAGTTSSLSIGVEKVSPITTGLVEFEVDTERMKSEINAPYTFIAPFARLVRSMRRCDRRHLPLLKGWIGVDVVMTQFEIVYFEAIDSYNSEPDETTKLHSEACRLALQATKGGKNLRLCDVARGRKVVGHLDFADVTEIHVEKDDFTMTDTSVVENDSVLYDKEQDLDVEHWSNHLYLESEANKKYARIIRWILFQEDRLKISTKAGTLYFRFYSDLALFEAEKLGEAPKNSNDITRDIAFQWAESICRICGRNQLEQNLPHFGENNEAELRDYLEVVHFHEKEAEDEMRNSTHGIDRAGNVDLLFLGAKGSNSTKKLMKHRLTKSMADFSGVGMASKSMVAFGSAELSATPEDESFQKGVPKSKRLHRTSKSMIDFNDVTRTLKKKGHRRSFSFTKELKEADNQV